MKKIIAVAGPKGIGKTSLCRYLQSLHELRRGNLVMSDGQVMGSDHEIIQFSETGRTKVFAKTEKSVDPVDFLSSVDSGIFSFASKVKNISTDVLGLDSDGVFGSETNKNLKTEYKWENMPIWVRWINSQSRSVVSSAVLYEKSTQEILGIRSEADLWSFCFLKNGTPSGLRSGFMSNREVMQVIGTDIFRNMFDRNVWVKCTIEEINNSKFSFCLIDDMRFDTEARAILEIGGYIINLFKEESRHDVHESEKGLSDSWVLSNKNLFNVKSGDEIMVKNNIVSDIIDEIINKRNENCLH